VRLARINGRPFVLHSEESVFGAAYGCVPQELNPFAGPAQPWLTDISNPADPRTVSQFGLEINAPRNCLRQIEAHENDSVHYHDVDDPNDTTFVMASMWNAGVRVFDVRPPRRPPAVASINPGADDRSAATKLDHAWGHIRWIPKSGQMWFATADGGFWVVHMESQVRNYLELDTKAGRAAARDPGRPGTVGVAMARPPVYLDTTPFTCTLGGIIP
jgi:hypothetical protein